MTLGNLGQAEFSCKKLAVDELYGYEVIRSEPMSIDMFCPKGEIMSLVWYGVSNKAESECPSSNYASKNAIYIDDECDMSSHVQ